MKSILIVFPFVICSCFAQTFQYDVLLVGSDVGDMSITRTVKGGKKHYKLETFTDVDYLLGRRKDLYTCEMEFENNVLVSSKVENKKDGKMNEYTYVTRYDGKGYKVQTHKGLSTISGNIIGCCYDIFYKEPLGGEQLFVERFGSFSKLIKTKDHTFKITVAGLDDYIYNFENGKMVKMEVPSILGKVKMVMK